MKHNELNKARIINMLSDSRRYLLKVRQGLNHEDSLFSLVKHTINNLEDLENIIKSGDDRMVAFDGVYFLKAEESEGFRERYKAHRKL